jgi:hypothetical protein
MRIFLYYYGAGVVAYILIRRLFRQTGVQLQALNQIWFGWIFCGEVLGVIFGAILWPLFALVSLVWWFGEYLHIASERKRSAERAEASKATNPYARLKNDELLAEQRRVLKESESQNGHKD